VIDTVFQHPNVPPYISRILIQRLVKSQPSPAYVKRISAVFKDDGTGVRGNLAAVARAILLDPEARAGDSLPRSDDGYLQDPWTWEIFSMSLLEISSIDAQPTYVPSLLGENPWVPGTVFSYFSPSYIIPGTQINSPEFQIYTQLSLVHRSELSWNMINSWGNYGLAQPIWLYKHFKTVPDILDALNHIAYHGTMSPAIRQSIIDYCNPIQDQREKMVSAVFLALNTDSYSVSH
jgi:hypothetical protein